MVVLFDFRSDTVTVPTAAMREIMMQAEVGDDVFEEDPTVNRLQERICELTGHESALFCASATMTNQLAMRSHLGAPPHSVLCDSRAHIYRYEASGIAYHSGATTIPVEPDHALGCLTAEIVAKNLVVDDDVHHAPTRVISLENTLNGEVFPIDEIRKISELGRTHGIKMHLDGARLWNASIATGISVAEYSRHFDSVSLCLSKGLGSPVGSVLVGSKELIRKARHFRKFFGGGWRQAGLLAAAGLYAIEHHWPKLAIDHDNAKFLADGLVKLGFTLTMRVDTNMVWVDSTPLNLTHDEMSSALLQNGSKIFGGGVGPMRWVCHHQITRAGIERALAIVSSCLTDRKI